MTVNYQLAFNKLCAKKLQMQRNEEAARASNIARAAIGGERSVEDGSDDDSSRDSFAVKAVMVPDDGTIGSCHGSSITKEGGRGVTWFVDRNGTPYDSPYENQYSAETNEELFHEVSDFFDSLKVLDPTQDTDHLNYAKNRLRDFKTYSNTVENSFITAVCCARDEVQESTVLWNDEWSGKRFGSRLGIKHSVPDDLLLIFVKPAFFAKAKRQDLLHFYTNRKLLPKFKEAIAKMDPGKKFPSLHKSPGRAFRQAAQYKMLIFIVRVHLIMKLRGCISFREFQETFGGGVQLKEKCWECFRKLEDAIFNTLKRDDANEHIVDADAGSHSWLTIPVASATPALPVTRARLNCSESSDQREAILRGAQRVEGHSESHRKDSKREECDGDAASDSNKKRSRVDADESDDEELDSMISKCDTLHKNWSRMLDEVKDIREYLVKQKKKDNLRTRKKGKIGLLKKIQDLVQDLDDSE